MNGREAAAWRKAQAERAQSYWYRRGLRHGRWARLNIPDVLDARGGQPDSLDVLELGPDWAAGYVAGAAK
jgi:hypothetical protein